MKIESELLKFENVKANGKGWLIFKNLAQI